MSSIILLQLHEWGANEWESIQPSVKAEFYSGHRKNAVFQIKFQDYF